MLLLPESLPKPMPAECPCEAAIARWMSLGVTSRTHPFLRHIYARCFAPLGIEADWLEAEPFSALESRSGFWWLRQPRWNPSIIDTATPAAADFRALIQTREPLHIEVEPQGALCIRPAAEQSWAAMRHSLRASHAAGSLIAMAAGLLIVDEANAALYASGDDDAFFLSVVERLGKTAPTEPPQADANTDHTKVFPPARSTVRGRIRRRSGGHCRRQQAQGPHAPPTERFGRRPRCLSLRPGAGWASGHPCPANDPKTIRPRRRRDGRSRRPRRADA